MNTAKTSPSLSWNTILKGLLIPRNDLVGKEAYTRLDFFLGDTQRKSYA